MQADHLVLASILILTMEMVAVRAHRIQVVANVVDPVVVVTLEVAAVAMAAEETRIFFWLTRKHYTTE